MKLVCMLSRLLIKHVLESFHQFNYLFILFYFFEFADYLNWNKKKLLIELMKDFKDFGCMSFLCFDQSSNLEFKNKMS